MGFFLSDLHRLEVSRLVVDKVDNLYKDFGTPEE